MRRRRVIKRGEPGGRRKPRLLSAFDSASRLTARSGEASMRSRTTARSSSWGAVCDSRSADTALAVIRAPTPADADPPRRPPRRPPRLRRRERPSPLGSSTGNSPCTPASRRYESRRNVTPRLAATSPTASNAWSSVTTSIMSPGRALASQTPAATALRRSLQSRTPTAGALCTSCAPWRARKRAVSWPTTRQLPTATRSVPRAIRSSARCAITFATCSGRLVFSTSKKIARRLVGRGRGAGGITRAAKEGSGVAVIGSSVTGSSSKLVTVSTTTGSVSGTTSSRPCPSASSPVGATDAARRRRDRPPRLLRDRPVRFSPVTAVLAWPGTIANALGGCDGGRNVARNVPSDRRGQSATTEHASVTFSSPERPVRAHRAYIVRGTFGAGSDMVSPEGMGARAAGTLDLATFNRWLCITRVSAAVAVALFAVLLSHLHVGHLALVPVLGVCAGLLLTSAIGLTWAWLPHHPRTFFHAQTFVDLAAVTLGIHYSAEGLTALLFRPIFALVVVPASLISVPSGLAVATGASIGHGLLLCLERGFSLTTVLSLEAIVPTFILFLVAQQCFFYGVHLEQKNVTLAGLAARLEESARRLVTEHRLSAALVGVARTLSSTLEASELLTRMNRTTSQQMRADWTATFLVDPARATYRLAAVTDGDAAASGLGAVELPLHSWRPIERLVREPNVVLTGDEAAPLPTVAGAPALSTVVLAALHSEQVLIGFLVVGYRRLAAADVDPALDLLAGIAQHAIIALRNVRLLEEVRAASAMKSEFVGAISHELRSPLNVMLGYLEMLLDQGCGPITREQAEALRRTQRQSLVLLEMITALLDLNRLEAGRLPVERAPVDIAGLL